MSRIASDQDIEDFAEKVRKRLGSRVKEIKLFGSYATDEYVPGSDIDILILVSEKKEEDRKKVWDIVGKFQEERELYFSPKIYEKSEFEQKVREGFGFHAEVAKQGLEL